MAVGERLWPEWIDLEARSLVRVLGDGFPQRAPQPEPDEDCWYQCTEVHNAPVFHGFNDDPVPPHCETTTNGCILTKGGTG